MPSGIRVFVEPVADFLLIVGGANTKAGVVDVRLLRTVLDHPGPSSALGGHGQKLIETGGWRSERSLSRP